MSICRHRKQHQLPLLTAKIFLIVIFVPLRLLLSAAPSSAASAEPARTTLHPHCQDKCGNVSIPYPFGIGGGCYLEGFEVRCNASYDPPRLFMDGGMEDSTLEVIDIELEKGRVIIYDRIDWACYNETHYVNGDDSPHALPSMGRYTFSSDENEFVVVGCSDLAILSTFIFKGQTAEPYNSGCVTSCSSLESAINGTCDGMGCCSTTIAKGLTDFMIYFDVQVVNNSQGSISKFNPCGYAFLVQRSEYKFSTSHLVPGTLNTTTYKNGVAPVVLDWVIAEETCEQAKRNSTSFACVSENSECLDSSDASGYLCNCAKGYQGNPYLSGGCQYVNECDEDPCYGWVCTNGPGNYSCSCPKGTSGDPYKEYGCIDKTFPLSLKVLIGTLGSLFFLTATSFWLYLGLAKRKLIRAKHKFFEQNGGMILKQQMTTPKNDNYFKIFTLEELEKATDKFDNKLIIGRGGYGTVYKGILEDKMTVAVKKSKIMEESQTKEFAREMLILSQINHKNVIKLLGCCLEVEVPMLVYEFVSNGNLFQYLHGTNHKFSIPLDTRLRIAEESADALAYLHSYASPPIIHGDVKGANILLDEQFTAKVSDFGASKLAPKDEVQFATVVQGTCGYLDPEYLVTCQLTEKSDVYSFGVIILELLTRRKPLEFDGSGEEKSLVTVFDSAMKLGNFAEIVDGEIATEENMGLIMEVAQLAMRCLNLAGAKRPTMKEVADNLQNLRRWGHFDRQGTTSLVYYDGRLEQAMTESIDHATASVIGDDTIEVNALLQVNLER